MSESKRLNVPQKIVRALSKEIEGLKARMSDTGAKDTIESEP